MSTIFYSMVFNLRTMVTLEFLQVITFESMLFSFEIRKCTLIQASLLMCVMNHGVCVYCVIVCAC